VSLDPAAFAGPGAVGGDRPGSLDRLRSLVREVPDYPQPGVLFRDLSPALADAEVFATVVARLAEAGPDAEVVLGIEARGFALGGGVAGALRLGMVCARKPGKLPVVAHRAEYSLEYGSAALELPADTLSPGQRVLVVDDVLATGGTLAAACELVEAAGAQVAGLAVVVELAALNGRANLAGRDLHALLTL
jgi:adenine phosphoribosyltransferase